MSKSILQLLKYLVKQFPVKVIWEIARNNILNKTRETLVKLEQAILLQCQDALKAKEYSQYFLQAAQQFGIKLTNELIAHTMGQFGYETFSFKRLTEYSPKERNEVEYFEERYGIRGKHRRLAVKLGNVEPGDGYKYRGRGFAQMTGKTNYQKYGEKLGLDLVNQPDLASDPCVAALVAVLYFKEYALNRITGAFEKDVINVSAAINNPSALHTTLVDAKKRINGFDDRLKLTRRILDLWKNEKS